MTTAVRDLLQSFAALPDPEKHELASEILRWSARTAHPALEDDELLGAADGIFLALDQQEEADQQESGG